MSEAFEARGSRACRARMACLADFACALGYFASCRAPRRDSRMPFQHDEASCIPRCRVRRAALRAESTLL
ncbi:hypothetical protein HMPREF0762_01583 [Slackia exigua ATCC 700122]|uniref:Uncharacterized protein n=1 Tax=Slackia exigua (strain ATCC 700122 / DSM 15923 / CIP 105133 / JCM 11022 / KCTC 5966 / S-7) TaxID=649764 RepID=D0WIB0_SLAES|nr:hypothetical protein HMPREF0762_01583 [Slackia exigua ATCC 700122]